MAVTPNPAVKESVLSEILSWRCEGATDLDVITRLRQQTVPSGYTPLPWSQGICNCMLVTYEVKLFAGKTEERVDMLRSILAQMEFHYRVCKWDSEGVPFRTHLYVPEVHSITKEYFLEREDEGHVFKVT